MTATRETVATYDYSDECGRLLFQVVRQAPKNFCIRRPDPDQAGEFAWGLGDTRRVLYQLPKLLADRLAPVFFVEGEKDVHTLMDGGLTATTIAGGCNGPWLPEFAETLRGRIVVLLPDNDAPGRAFMERVAQRLAGVAAQIRYVELPNLKPKGDVTDWLDAGGSIKDLLEVVMNVEPLKTVADADGLLRLDQVIPKPIEWLWKPWLPVGKLCLIDGDPGQGKSFVTLDLAARLSRGDVFPDGQPGPAQPTPTLFITCEDGVEDTIVPRLEALKADRSLIHCYQGPMRDGKSIAIPKLPDDFPQLERQIVKSGAKLVIIDPLMAFLGASINSISDQSVRSMLSPLVVMAERLRITILFVRHLNKTNGKQAVYRGGGSIGIIAAMRSGMLIARHPHDRDMRVLAIVKCNLGPEPKSLGFRLVSIDGHLDHIGVSWQGPVDLYANDLVGDVKETITPREWLREALATGPRRVLELLSEAKDCGYSESTINRAKAAMGLTAKQRKDKDGTPAWWWLPPGQTTFDTTPGVAKPAVSVLEPLTDLEPIAPSL